MTPVEILEKARELLSDPKRWTRDALAMTARGKHLSDPTDRRAACWCVFGAIMKCSGEVSGALNAADVFERANWFGDDESFSSWNDRPERTHAEVLAAIDSAIALARSE